MKSRLRIPRKFRILIGILAFWVLAHTAYVLIDGFRKYEGKADLAIVLGNTVFPDSTLSSVLKGRVDKALQLFREGRVQRIFVSGGDGRPKFWVPEGMAMKHYLVARGVPENRIIEDNNGQNTYLTAKDFMSLNDSLHFSSAIVVTSFYHITRSKYIIRKLGFKNIYGACSEDLFWKDMIGMARDFFAFYKYLILY